LSQFPIVVVATTTVSAALADWRAQIKFLITGAVLSALAIAFILFLIVRQMNRQNQDSQRRLEAEKQRLDTALNNMTQGLVLYDASGHIVICNQRYIDMYKLSTEVVKPGCHFYDLSAIVRRPDPSTVTSMHSVQTLNGTLHEAKSLTAFFNPRAARFLIVNKPLAQGGWVATIEDITERQNLEQERDRNYAFRIRSSITFRHRSRSKMRRDRRYLLVNRVAEAQFGLSRAAIVGKTALDLFPRAAADRIAADDDKALQSADGLFLDEHPWESPGLGHRFLTSKRIGIQDQTGAGDI